LVPLLFGNQWEVSVPLTQALAVGAILTLGAMLDQSLFYGLGRPGGWLAYAVVVDLMAVGVTAVAVNRGLTAVALGTLAVGIASTVARWVMVSRLVRGTVASILRPFVHMAINTALSGGLGLLTMSMMPSTTALLVQVAVPASVIVATCLALIRLTQRDALVYAFETLPLPNSLNRRLRKAVLLRESDKVSG
jgi:O-antigen/teichoic acid export membrane protein